MAEEAVADAPDPKSTTESVVDAALLDLKDPFAPDDGIPF